jgi:hypothetical protein
MADLAVEVELRRPDGSGSGERVSLLPERAMFWPAMATIVVADLHLGKGETFRRSGVPVPRGQHDETLSRLDRLVRRTKAHRVLVLGDLLHAPAGLTESMIEDVESWRARQDVHMELVPGNHDRRGLKRVADAWRIAVLDEVVHEGMFAWRHEPKPVPGKLALGGHVHPTWTLRGGGDALRLPCFAIGRAAGVLPAFCTFTAGPAPSFAEQRVWVVAEGRVVQVE